MASAWRTPLQPASFKGVNFEVVELEYETGREVVLHKFPFRDLPLAEDLGMALQRFKVRGFLIGDDVYDQRDELMSIAQQEGEGELIHPSLGSLDVVLMYASFAEAVGIGRSVEISLDFVLVTSAGSAAGTITTTDGASSIQSSVTDFSGVMSADSAAQFSAATQNDGFFDNLGSNISQGFQEIGSGIKQGTAAINGVVKQVNGYVGQVRTVIGDASRLVHAADGIVNLIPGQVGSRYARIPSIGSGLSSINGVLNVANQQIGNVNKFTNGVNGLVGLANRGYSDVLKAASSVSNLASFL